MTTFPARVIAKINLPSKEYDSLDEVFRFATEAAVRRIEDLLGQSGLLAAADQGESA